MVNTSGQGKSAEIPAELGRWNWGAFLLGIIWGIGNRTYISFLTLVPFVNIVMPFLLGAKGNAWAWRNKHWESVEHFKSVQRKWALWGVIFYIVFIPAVIGGAMYSFKNSEAYKLGVSRVQSSSEAIAVLGAPISTGIPFGNVKESGAIGKADLAFSVEGSKSKGTVYLRATKNLGSWNIDGMILKTDGQQNPIDLGKTKKVVSPENEKLALPVAASAPAIVPQTSAHDAGPEISQKSIGALPEPHEKEAIADAHRKAARPLRNENLTYCLELKTDEAIAKCVEDAER